MKRSAGSNARFGKKAASTVLDFSSVEAQDLSLEAAPGYPPDRVYLPDLLVSGRKALFKLASWAEARYGFDARTWDKSESPGDPETARLALALDAATATRLAALDARVAELFRATAPAPFEWQPALKADKGRDPAATVKVFFAGRLGAAPVRATLFKVRAAGASATGEGWAFFQRQAAQHDGFRQTKCKVALSAQLWHMDGKAGLTLQAYAVALAPQAAGLGVDELFPDSELE